MTTRDYTPLWHWVREREALRVRKDAGEPQPWTGDPILSRYRFCNVRREDDRVTAWIRKHIREPFADHPHLWLMLCIARQINWPATLAYLIDECEFAWPHESGFDPRQLGVALNARAAQGDKVYTGAYKIPAPRKKGADKQTHTAETVIGGLWRRRERFAARTWTRIADAHAWLMQVDGWGPFMAYQACADMRFTRILRDASDVPSWAAAGPGTLRGLNRVHGRAVDHALSQAQALREMRAIYAIAQAETGVAMDFSDVPNILCETDKYLRAKLGEGKPRALYVPGRGA